MNKKLFIAILTIGILSAGLLGATGAFAQSTQTPTSSLVQKIADKFGLKQEDVQSVFDQNRQERRAQMEAMYEAQLSQYVKDGKITDAQKQLILNKHKELETTMKNEMQDFKNLTAEQRKAQMTAKKQALETWAKDNGINIQYLRPFGHGMRGFGMKFGAPSQ